ncbi:transient receptor potential cation channel subfamily A member 1 isoform X1 [Rhopalosiphum maidis]|uniref:transient receptor potential cation channel subfamily A member 1 isoform X1 n=1 Tax=Rhopalosiphum maidis TaxID=43146 RepID=UPI000EFE2113|nr:transient receptor potential cation channel subfamily A member 1 isoform X1 [Rhopalosiphum maidis]XP_026809343.1 transient receptor potential cation channel subfamily A member 1 isoform X1 [Rhopalosiphum maidis]
MKEEPTRDGGIRWMSWVIGSSKNVQRNDDTIPGKHRLWQLIQMRRIHGSKVGGTGRMLSSSEKLSLTPLIFRQSSTVDGDVCLLTDSPYRILRAAESGNLDDFNRLFIAEPARLDVRDSKGRAAVHQAAARNKLNILQFIRNHGGDLNLKDSFGNTPLHIAIEHNSLDAVEYLFQNGADPSALNDKKQAALHLAVELNRVAVLQVMCKFKDRIEIGQGGKHGRTALHLAAIHDNDECARILMRDLGADNRQPCHNGYYPIHEAAKNAASRTMEVLLQWAESRGNSRHQMISFFDAEGNVPLHSAVHSGDFKAVELCLKSGAKISTQQYDLSTPVHLACAQGAIDIVRLMFGLQPDEKAQCLCSCDVQKMTPLHCAAMFDRSEIVQYLIEEGADINALDKESRSPLLLAASRSGWRTVASLIRLGADIQVKDSSKRNVLHLVVMYGGRLDEFAHEITMANHQGALELLLNEKDNTGCSPLHYASRGGHIRSLESLIRLGACVNIKNYNGESPLHFGARYGRYNIVKRLLNSEKGAFIINESDGEGLTPLHIASQQGHTKVVQLFLNRGALLHRDHKGRNPLHLAAMSGHTQTIELLHSVHSHLLDQCDKDKNTALHLATMENKPNAITLLLYMNCKLLFNSLDLSAIDYAIYYKFPEAALAMVTHDSRAEEIMTLKSDRHPCVTLALIASMPRVFEAVQDKCITKANCKKDSKQFYIKYSFSCLQCPMVQKNGATGTLKPTPLPALNAMVNHGRVELLAHPLSQKYLQMKWNTYGKYFHLAHLLFYTIFLIFVTLFSSQLMVYNNQDNMYNATSNALLTVDTTTNVATLKTVAVMIVIYVFMNSAREGIQFYQQGWPYLLDPTNVVAILLYFSAIAMIAPILTNCLPEYQISFASITVFLSWFTLLLNLQRFDQVGIYVVMFLEILQTLIKVLLLFSILIAAFGLAFYILLSRGNHLSFSTIPMSLLRTFAMMLGEIDLLGTYIQPLYAEDDDQENGQARTPRTIPYPVPVFLMLGVFMVLMPILLMNLLIGLAVGDIESVRRNAQLKRLAMQVVLHTELERKLPHVLMEKIDKAEQIEYPNERKTKMGFLDFILRKWFCNPFSDDAIEMVLENNENHLADEIGKVKDRLKTITSSLENQQTFLRLIIQKMEIKTEEDEVDEGVSAKEMAFTNNINGKWSSPRVRTKLKTSFSFSKCHTK